MKKERIWGKRKSRGKSSEGSQKRKKTLLLGLSVYLHKQGVPYAVDQSGREKWGRGKKSKGTGAEMRFLRCEGYPHINPSRV